MAALTTGKRPIRKAERGAELIEFAFALPILLFLIAGIIDFGLLFKDYEVVTNAAREGARLGTLPGYGNADITDRVREYAGSGGLYTDPTALTITPQATTVSVGGGKPAASAIQVNVTYGHQILFLGPLAALVGGGAYGTVNLNARSTMRLEIQ